MQTRKHNNLLYKCCCLSENLYLFNFKVKIFSYFFSCFGHETMMLLCMLNKIQQSCCNINREPGLMEKIIKSRFLGTYLCNNDGRRIWLELCHIRSWFQAPFKMADLEFGHYFIRMPIPSGPVVRLENFRIILLYNTCMSMT